MKIIVDEREHDLYEKCVSLISENPSKYKQIYLSKQVLPLGDILIKTDGENATPLSTPTPKKSTKPSKIPFDKDILLIERKTFSDLLSSIRDGRYKEQSHRLSYSSGVPSHNIIYLLEGMFSQTKENDRHTIMSCITSLNYFKGFSVMRTANVKESAEWLLCTADKIQRELNIFGGGITGTKNEFFETKCRKIPNLHALDNSLNSLIDTSVQQSENEEHDTSTKNVIPTLLNTFSLACEGEPKFAVAHEGKFVETLAEPNIEISSSSHSLNIEPPEYCTVVKKEKNKNITPENIGTIFLCQIPFVHSVSAIAIMQKFSSIQTLIECLVKDSNCLNDIYTETNGKKRKLSKSIIENIKKYLLNGFSEGK